MAKSHSDIERCLKNYGVDITKQREQVCLDRRSEVLDHAFAVDGFFDKEKEHKSSEVGANILKVVSHGWYVKGALRVRHDKWTFD